MEHLVSSTTVLVAAVHHPGCLQPEALPSWIQYLVPFPMAPFPLRLQLLVQLQASLQRTPSPSGPGCRELLLHQVQASENSFPIRSRLQRTPSPSGPGCRELLLHQVQAVENSFSIRSRLQRTPSPSGPGCRELLLHQVQAAENSFSIRCRLQRTPSPSGPSCRELLLHQVQAAENSFSIRSRLQRTPSPSGPGCRELLLHQGHACPILYAAWCEAGLVSKEHLLTLRKVDSILEGHPLPHQNYIDVATDSLGQGLSVSAGMAYCGKYLDKASYRVYCLMGDGESAEGSVWEAASSSHYKLDNLVAIVDVNRLGQSQPTALQHDMETYRKRFDAFGFKALVVDGHNIQEIYRALHTAKCTKDHCPAVPHLEWFGRGFPNIEDKENWHGKPLGSKEADISRKAIEAQIHNHGHIHFDLPKIIHDAPKIESLKVHLSEPPKYKLGDKIATRKTYGEALVKLGKTTSHLVALDGDTKNSTFAITYKNAFPERFVECFIAEQNLVGVGIGLGTRNRNVVFCSAFAAFFTRAFDQIRMGAFPYSLKLRTPST
eukprot:Em0003g1842a